MQTRVFVIPVVDAQEATAEYDNFINSHRVIETERRFVEEGMRSCWVVWVSFADGTEVKRFKNEPIDYQKVLSKEDYEAFNRLRDIRKEISQSEGIAVYLVFENKELAEIATAKLFTIAAMQGNKVLNAQRVEKYGRLLLEKYVPNFDFPM